MPRIAMLEGYRGIPGGKTGRPARSQVISRQAMGRLGATTFCREFDDAMGRVKLAYSQAVDSGVPETDSRMQIAKDFIDRETGIWSTWVAWGDACTNLVTEANNVLGGLNTILATQGGSIVPPSAAGQSTATLASTLGDVKWIIWGLGGVLALVYLGPVVKSLTRGK